jgi:5-methylcytosine-specific restriction endonuclease McrA
MHKHQKTLRDRAFVNQKGQCHYCGLPMLPTDCDSSNRTVDARRCLKATAEHLIARCDGGGTTATNIVAAHALCNMRRHHSKRPPDPSSYREKVRERVASGRWFCASMRRSLLAIAGPSR